MTTKSLYVNKYNKNKFILIHNDGHRHNAVKPFMCYPNGVINYLGDKCFHRWRKANLEELLKDYVYVCEALK